MKLYDIISGIPIVLGLVTLLKQTITHVLEDACSQKTRDDMKHPTPFRLGEQTDSRPAQVAA